MWCQQKKLVLRVKPPPILSHLGADPHVLIGAEFRPLVFFGIDEDEGGEVGGDDGGNGHQEKSGPPLGPSAI